MVKDYLDNLDQESLDFRIKLFFTTLGRNHWAEIGACWVTSPERELRRWRERANQTQDEVAATVGVSSQAVSLWEQGKRPRLRNIRALDQALHAGGRLAAAYGVTASADDTEPSAVDLLREVLDRLDALEQRFGQEPPPAP